MNKFTKGKIYKITNDVTDQIYIGSTIQTLCHRMGQHREKLHDMTRTSLFYKTMRSINVSHFKISLIEHFPCESKRNLMEREDYFIQLLKPELNQRFACSNEIRDKAYMKNYNAVYNASHKDDAREKRNLNAKHIKEQMHEWGIKKVVCIACNKTMSKSSLYLHNKTMKHDNNINSGLTVAVM
jgi:hypothetical protein